MRCIKAQVFSCLILVLTALAILFFVYKAHTKFGIKQYAQLSDKGLFVKDFAGNNVQAKLIGDDIYLLDGTYVGKRVEEK